MSVLRSTCLCVLCHVYAQIYILVFRSMFLCLDLCVYVLCAILATRLAFFASLHLCMLAYMFMHEFICHSYSNPMELQTLDPNLHLSSQFTPFYQITCLFASSCASHVCLPSFGIFCQLVFQHAFFYLFLCFSSGQFILSLQVHAQSVDICSEGTTTQVQVKRARMQARGYKPTKGNVQQIEGLAPPEWSSFSLSLSHFSRACIRVPPLFVPFIFPTPCLGHVPWYGNVCFTFLLYVIALCMMYVYTYICLYLGDCALCMMDFHGYVNDPLQS